MKLEIKDNNYSAIVVEIDNLVKLENCDNVQHAIIMGNRIIVSNDTKVGDIGIFFPVEAQLSKDYCSFNNLYRDKEENEDNSKVGYFEENRRIKCVKFRGNKSEGLFMPLSSIGLMGVDTTELNVGDEFTDIEGINICQKYIMWVKNVHNNPKGKKAKESKIVDGQFNFHAETSQLYRNLFKVNPSDLISLTYKMHGTSGISSKVLCKKKTTVIEKILLWLGVAIIITVYDYIYSSRKIIKNPSINPNANHYYDVDIWGLADAKLRSFLSNGMTLYYEIVGYTPNGAEIQKDYTYGCAEGEFDIYIYRVTNTNDEGKVFEWSAKQVQDWCKLMGLKAVPELFYGRASEFFSDGRLTDRNWREGFLNELKTRYNDKDCYMCSKTVPEEGVVVRIEGLDLESFKCKSEKFYLRETAQLSKGVIDIEESLNE